MAQQSKPFMGYAAWTIQVTNTAQNLVALIGSQLGILNLPPEVQEYQIQVDPEDSSGNSVRIGTGNLGQSLGGFVQKGITLSAGAADTARTGICNGKHFAGLFVQTVSGTQKINVQVWIW